MKRYTCYTCKDCSVGSESPCIWYSLNPDDEEPVSCPLGKCGEDAKWLPDTKYPSPNE